MIDSSRSPRPLWNRILMAVLLVVSIVVAAWIIWVKELHHQDIHIHTVAFAHLGVVLSSLAPW